MMKLGEKKVKTIGFLTTAIVGLCPFYGFAQEQGFAILADEQFVSGDRGLAEKNLSEPETLADWFYVGLIDATVHRQEADRKITKTGQVAFFTTGVAATGLNVTASVNTGEQSLENVFKGLDQKDPASLTSRLDPSDQFLTYGDDSIIEYAAPTDGKAYLKLEQGKNRIVWGNSKTTLAGSKYLRQDRMIYGLNAQLETPAETIKLSGYAARPDRMTTTDILKGTGGSLYFLKQQDVTVGSEIVSVIERDRLTGRILSQRILTRDVDYQISYMQGAITLTRPLDGATDNPNSIISQSTGDHVYDLSVGYDYTPSLSSLGSTVAGGDLELKLTNSITVGVSAASDKMSDQSYVAQSTWAKVAIGKNSTLELEQSKSKGALSRTMSTSANGGLTVDDVASAYQPGKTAPANANRAALTVDLADLGLAPEGKFNVYHETRDSGYVSQNYNVSSDETLSGFDLTLTPASGKSTYRLSYDSYEQQGGKNKTRASIGMERKITEQTNVSVQVDEITDGSTQRTDVGLEMTHDLSDAITLTATTQGTVKSSGNIAKNDRTTVGLRAQLTDTIEAQASLSDGTTGARGELRFDYRPAPDRTYYLGYEIDKTGNDDIGIIIAGTRQTLNDRMSTYVENRSDIMGTETSTLTAVGAEYSANSSIKMSGDFQQGHVKNAADHYDRTVMSTGLNYSIDKKLDFSLYLEYRKDRGIKAGSNQSVDQKLARGDFKYDIAPALRAMGGFDIAMTNAIGENNSMPDSHYQKYDFGFAYRPVDNDRLNVLAKYTYLDDQTNQLVNGTATLNDKQKSNVVSMDVDYDLNEHWTVGGKLGYRSAQSASVGSEDYIQNNARLSIGRVTYTVPFKWDILTEYRDLESFASRTRQSGVLIAGYRHVNDTVKIGLGYNFTNFSNDLLDLTQNDRGAFLNVAAKF